LAYSLSLITIIMPNTDNQIREYEELMEAIANSDMPAWVAGYGYTIEPAASTQPANTVLTD
jgi:hypothetical protein